MIAKKNNIIITIIIAVYNSDKTLEKCLQSIINQSYENIEIIIIDNLSNDNTSTIIKNYLSYITHYVFEKDSGIYEAWNKGVKLANGEWICFLGADDYLLNHSLVDLVKMTENNPNLNFISGKIKLLDGSLNGKVVGEMFSSHKIKYFQNFAHIGSITKKTLIVNNLYFNPNYKISGDYDFYLKNKNQIKPGFLNKIIVNSETGISQISEKVFHENYQIWKKNNTHLKSFSFFLYCYRLLTFRLKKVLIFYNY